MQIYAILWDVQKLNPVGLRDIIKIQKHDVQVVCYERKHTTTNTIFANNWLFAYLVPIVCCNI